ncbi:MAG: SDR family oxidoreductase, partial [Anaerolineae bacterium]|nr:SDR family oxidoreductase [Anaerolineae bacterium]
IAFSGVGVSGRRWGDGPAHECTEDAWNRVLNINLTSMFHVCKHVLNAMLTNENGGSLITLASVLGIVGGDDDFSTHAYAASKGGIISFTRAMASYYAKHHIRANVIAPGLILTPMSQRAQANEYIQEKLQTLQPLTGAMGQPEDIAGAAAYLASDDAKFVTGTVLTVDGGWTMR